MDNFAPMKMPCILCHRLKEVLANPSYLLGGLLSWLYLRVLSHLCVDTLSITGGVGKITALSVYGALRGKHTHLFASVPVIMHTITLNTFTSPPQDWRPSVNWSTDQMMVV